MPDVNVSRDSLEKAKNTLGQFKTDVSHIPASMSKHIELTENECEQTIGNLKNQIAGLTYKIKKTECIKAGIRDGGKHKERFVEYHLCGLGDGHCIVLVLHACNLERHHKSVIRNDGKK